jgi:hypothetical protein
MAEQQLDSVADGRADAADMELLHTLMAQAKRGEGLWTRESSEGSVLDAGHMDRWRILAEHTGVGRTLLRMFWTLLSLHRSEECGAFALAVGLAAFNQITASTSIINYAPEVRSTSKTVH